MTPEEQVTGEPLIVAFDIPVDATADEAARIIGERCGSSRYVNTVVQWPGAGMRVFLRLHAAATAVKYARAGVRLLEKEKANARM